jgi:hypothetical protein
VLGVERIPFDGPVQLVSRGPFHSSDDASVQYESIGAGGSTRVTVSPRQPAFVHTVRGMCWSCMDGSHDFELWPFCPRGRTAPQSGIRTSARPTETPQNPPDGPARVPVGDPEPAQTPQQGMATVPPLPSPAVESTARTLAIQVRQSGVKPKSAYAAHGIPPGDVEAWISHAVNQQWVVVDGEFLRPGSVSPHVVADLPAEEPVTPPEVRWGPGPGAYW